MKLLSTNKMPNSDYSYSQQVVEGEFFNNKTILKNRVQVCAESHSEAKHKALDSRVLMLYLNTKESNTNVQKECNDVLAAIDNMYALSSSVNHFHNKPGFSKPSHP